jgi:hypothetical protein
MTTDKTAFEPGPYWEGKTDFAPGLPDDPASIPVTRYQVLGLLQTVFTVRTLGDGSTTRGQLPLDSFEQMIGKKASRSGWYNALGDYLGDSLI